MKHKKSTSILKAGVLVFLLTGVFFTGMNLVMTPSVSAATTTVGYTEYNGQNSYMYTRYNVSWTAAVNSVVAYADPAFTETRAYCTPTTNILQRGFLVYDTSAIPDDKIISSVSLSVPISTAYDSGYTYIMDSGSGEAIARADFNKANFGDLYCNYNWDGGTGTYNMSFNQNVSDSIVKDGYTCLVLRHENDYLDSAPGSNEGYLVADEHLVKLWVTYSDPPVFPIYVSDVSPAPGATDVVTNPELCVNVTHLTSARVNITWYAVDLFNESGVDDSCFSSNLLPQADDQDWYTYEMEDPDFDSLPIWYENYSIPSNVLSAVYRMKVSVGDFNFTVPVDCFDEDMVRIRRYYNYESPPDHAVAFYYDGIYTSPGTHVNYGDYSSENTSFYESSVTFICDVGGIEYRLPSYYGYDGEECNHTYYSRLHRYDLNPWLLNHTYNWYVNITDGLGNSRNFPNESSNGTAYSSWYLWNFTTRSTNNTDNLTIYDNTVNTTGTNQYVFYNGTGWVQWVNQTGNTTPLHLFENIINAAGSHDYLLNLTGYYVWANYTGTGGGTGGCSNLSVINPNPGNGSHSTNYLRNDSGGLTTAVDVSCINFTDPAAALPGDYSLTYTMTAFSTGDNVQNISGVSYATCRNNTNGQVVTGPLTCGQYESAGDYWICRNYLAFNTSTVPDEATITSAYVALVVYEADYTDVDFQVMLQQVKPPIPHTPLVSGDYSKTAFPSDVTHATFAVKNISGYTDEDWFNMTLNASGIADINLSGFTYMVMRSDQDVYHDAPGAGVDEWIQFYGTSGVTPGYNPRLIVNYTIPSSNWAHYVNLTWRSNSSGAWLSYYVSHVNSNGTVAVPAVNFSSNQSYFWNVSYSNDGSDSGVTQVFTFMTVNITSTGVPVFIATRTSNNLILGLSIGVFFAFPLGIVMFVRRRREDV